MKIHYRHLKLALAVLGISAVPEACQAATVSWNVTELNPYGHYLSNPDNCYSEMKTIIQDASNYLSVSEHSNDTLILYFPSGTYNFKDHAPAPTHVPAVLIKNQTSGTLILRGAGSDLTKLIFSESKEHGIYVFSSKNITIERMHLTRPGYLLSPAGYVTQGVLLDSGTGTPAGHVRFQVHPGFPDPYDLYHDGDDLPNQRVLTAFSPSSPLDPITLPFKKAVLDDTVDAAGNTNGITVVDQENGIFDAKLASPTQFAFRVGDWVSLTVKSPGDTIRFAGTGTSSVSDCVCQDLLITKMSGRAIAAVNYTDRLTVRRVRIDRPAPIGGHGVCLSSPAGGIILVSGTGAPTVVDNVVVGTGDDGILVGTGTSSGMGKNDGAVIIGNTIRDNVGRGIVVASSTGVNCQGNNLIRNTYTGLLLKDDDSAPGGVFDSLFAYNVFNQLGGNPVILLTSDRVDADAEWHKGNFIQGNVFLNASKNNHMVSVGFSGTNQVRKNLIASFSDFEDQPSTDVTGVGNSLIYVLKGNIAGSGIWANTTGVSLPSGRQAVEYTGTGTGTVVWSYGGTTAALQTMTFTSAAADDGIVIESSTGSHVGGSNVSGNPGWAGLQAGDDSWGRQLRTIVSFDTSALPDTAMIVSAKLRLKRGGIIGQDPFRSQSSPGLGTCWVDIIGVSAQSDGFNGSNSLENGDFQAWANMTRVATMSAPNANGVWSEGDIIAGLRWINLEGKTQFRVYFETPTDNDGTDDIMSFYPGEHQYRPQLEVVYRAQ